MNMEIGGMVIFYLLLSAYLASWILELLCCYALSRIRGYKGSLNSATTITDTDGHEAKDAESNDNTANGYDTIDNNSKTGGHETSETSSKIKYSIISFINGAEKRCIYRVSRIPSHAVRMFFYRHVFKVGMPKDVVVYSGVILRKPSYISIGEGTVIGDRCELDGRGGLVIGSDCNLSSEVHIWTAQHDSQSSDFAFMKKPVTIGDRCWISSNTVILPGVKVGDGVVLAAGAVLAKDALPYGIYAGVPAKKIGERNRNLIYHFDGGHDWFM